jgi:hypothetical protein
VDLEQNMSDRNQERWEQLLDQELKALPDLAAPETLLNRIMSAARERSVQPWWHRSWQSWPPGLQGVGLFLLLATAGAVSYLGAVAVDEIRFFGLAMVLGSWLEPLGVGLDLLSTIWRAAVLLFKAGGQQLLVLTVLLVLGLYIACVGLGTACTRMLLHRT